MNYLAVAPFRVPRRTRVRTGSFPGSIATRANRPGRGFLRGFLLAGLGGLALLAGCGRAAPGIIVSVAGNLVQGYTGNGGAAISAELDGPTRVAVDSARNFYIADTGNHVIRMVTFSTGIISVIAGTQTAGYSGDGGAATSAELDLPHGIAVDSSGNLFFADTGNNVVREVIASTSLIATVAGTGAPGYSGDRGPATQATLLGPEGVALDSSGALYIADTGNNRIRRVDPATGTITTVAGTGAIGAGGDGGPATAAQLFSPQDVAVDASGNLYIADSGNSSVRKVASSSGNISTLAGHQTYIGHDLAAPTGLALDAFGNLYIADTGNNVVRRLGLSNGAIATVAGTGFNGYSGDNGPATAANIASPQGVAVNSIGVLFVADTGNNLIRMVTF